MHQHHIVFIAIGVPGRGAEPHIHRPVNGRSWRSPGRKIRRFGVRRAQRASYNPA